MVLLRLLRAGLFAMLLAAAPSARGQVRIDNVAQLRWTTPDGAAHGAVSNRVSLALDTARAPTAIGFRAVPPGMAVAAAACGPPIVATALDERTLAAATPIRASEGGGAVVVTLSAPAEDRDPHRVDGATVSLTAGGGAVPVVLTETAPGSGMFAGIVAPASCGIRPGPGTPIEARFAGSDRSDASSATLLVDPGGRAFDSRTGALVDGAVVTLLDAAGNPASVLGDDGISRYPARVTTGAAVTDAGGRVYAASPGRYRFPLVPPGRYKLRVEPPPGYGAPSTAAPAALATLRDPAGAPFALDAASYGGAMTVAADAPFVADIPLDRAGDADMLLLDQSASVRDAQPGDVVQYRLTLTNRGTDASGPVDLRALLPAGLTYRRSSTRGAPEPVVAADGHALDFAVPSLAPRMSATIRYLAAIAPGARPGELLDRAQAWAGGAVASNVAIAAVRVRALLFTDALTVIGRVTLGECTTPERDRRGVTGIRLLLEDGTYVVTDRDGLYHIEGVPAGRHVVALDEASLPPTLAAARCGDDTRAAGSATSRFVEGVGGLTQRVDFRLRATGQAPAPAMPPPIPADDAAAAGNRDWLAGQAPGVGWLFPDERHNPRAPVLRVVVKHHPGERVALTVNGVRPDPLMFDDTDIDHAHDVAVSRWSGLPLAPGANRLEARVLGEDGRVVATLVRTVFYAGPPARVVIDPAHSRLVADGLTRPLLAVRVTDRDGRPVRDGTLVPFAIDAPYAAAIDATLEQRRQPAGSDRAGAVARVTGDAGVALLALQPTTQAGAVRATVTLADDRGTRRTTELRGWLAGAARQWTVLGFGAGSLGYDLLSRHLRGLGRDAAGAPAASGELALYAKGRVRGAWLLTMSYASGRRYDPDRGLLGTIDPDRYYTVYGDGSRQGHDAPTRGKLYLRLERRDAYALFGDVETGFGDTVLGRYRRTLNGFKAAYEGRRVRAAAFAADTGERHGRDEIRGNGLSGPYTLAARAIVPNSDQVRIEVRDRFRPERIVSSTPLTRHIDYDVDATIGTLRFRDPVLSRDAALNPVFIVVDYEVEGGGLRKPAAGARAVARLADGRVEAGVTALRDETIGRATLIAADLKVRVTAADELRAELASGGIGGLGAGGAFLIEGEHRGPRLDLLAYARRQDAGFGVGQQDLVEAGTGKLGADGRLRLTDRLSIAATGWYQRQLIGDGARTALDAKLDWRTPLGSAFAGVQLVHDTGLDGRDRDSRLLTLGGSRVMLGGRLTIDGETQVAPGGDKASVDFPVRHVVTATWRAARAIRLIAGYEIADGADFTAHTARIGVDLALWAGAALLGTLDRQQMGEKGVRTYAQYGLAQSLPLGRRWSVDATLDAASTVSGHISAGAAVTPFQPIASGGSFGGGDTDGDHVAATLGATYRAARWSWTGRAEYRDGAIDDRYGLTASLLRALGEGRTLAAGVRAWRLRGRSGNGIDAAADIALALRPLGGRWSLLDRLSLRRLDTDAGVGAAAGLALADYGGAAGATTRIVNDLAVGFRSRPGESGGGGGIEATVYYGAKYVRGRLSGDAYAGFIDATGFELRRDLGRRLDIGLQGSIQHGWSDRGWAWSGGPQVGVSPAGNIWISAGWNLSGYRDRDLAADRYTRAGPYLTLRAKIDRRSIGDAAHALFGGRG